jgi:hypothetical protein
VSADNNSGNLDGEPNAEVLRRQGGTPAAGTRSSTQSSGGEAVSITVGQKRISSDSISARDSVTEENRQILGSTAMSESSSLFVLGLRDNKQSAGIPGLLLQDNKSSEPANRKKEIQTVQEDWLGPDTTLDTQALHRIVQPEHGAEEQKIHGSDKVTDQSSEINRVMRVYRTGIDHVFAGNLQAGIDMITATKAILEGNNVPSSVIAELNHYLALAYAGLEQKPGQESISSTNAAASDAVHFGVSGNLQVQNIFDTLTAEQVVHSDSGFHDIVQSSQPSDSSVFNGIDRSVILDSTKQPQSSGAVETTDLELVTDEPEAPPAVQEVKAEPAGKKPPTKDRQPENQNQDPARVEEQAQQAQEAREKRKQIALKLLRKLPFQNLRLRGPLKSDTREKERRKRDLAEAKRVAAAENKQ